MLDIYSVPTNNLIVFFTYPFILFRKFLNYLHFPPISRIATSALKKETLCFSEMLALPTSLHGAKIQNIVIIVREVY
jgi:hypothetical protein